MQLRPSTAGPVAMAFRLLVLATAAVAVAGLMAACGGDSGGHDGGQAGGEVRAVTSIDLFADLVRHVGGERVRVKALVPGGGDPHTYELAPAQVVDVTDADVVFLNGLGLEETLEGVIESNVKDGVPIVRMSEGLPVLDGGDDGAGNPHLWLNVRYAMRYVERIRDALIEVDPEGEEAYRSNAAAYLSELEALDSDVEKAIAAIPAERRKLVTFHDAFSYFAQRYGLEVVAFVIRSPGREPSAGEIADLVEKIRAEDVPAVFKEPQLKAQVLELAAGEAGAEVCTLYSDALDSEVDSYVKLIRHNVDELVRCLSQ
jgi:manganese/iron transport system substrate-binding protein